MGTREGVASKIEQDTKRRIDEMNRAIVVQKEGVKLYHKFYVDVM